MGQLMSKHQLALDNLVKAIETIQVYILLCLLLLMPSRSEKLTLTKVVNLVSLEQFHNKPMGIYGIGAVKVALVGKWASSLQLDHHHTFP